MAFDAGAVVGRIKADLANFKKGLTEAKNKGKTAFGGIGGSIDSMNKKIKQMTPQIQKMSLKVGAVGVATGLVVKDWINLGRAQERTEKQLDAVIKATDSAAGVTADFVKGVATSIQQVSNVGDEAVIAGQNMLLTFKNIKGEEIFERTTKALVDMTVSMNNGATPSAEQLNTQAIQLGKALNDPITGVTALSRVGITFTKEQKNMIKVMQETGDIAGAQTIVLKELESQFQGSAEAQADSLIQLGNTFGDFKEELGMALLPVLRSVSEGLKTMVEGFQALSPGSKKAIATIGLVVAVLSPLLAAFGIFVTLIPAITAGFAAIGSALLLLASPVGIVLSAITAFVLFFKADFLGIQGIVAQIGGGIVIMFDKIHETVIAVGGGISIIFDAIHQKIIEVGGGITIALQAVADFFTDVFFFAIETIQEFWSQTWDTLLLITQVISEGIKTIITGFLNAIKAALKVFKKIIEFDWSALWTKVKNTASAIWTTIKEKFMEFINAISNALSIALGGISDVWTKSWNGVKDVFIGVWNAIKSALASALNFIIDKINFVIAGLNKLKIPGTDIGINIRQLDRISLAEGAIVSRPVNAIVGDTGDPSDPEVVSPLSKLRDMLGGGVGGTTFVFQGPVYDREMARELMEDAWQEMRPQFS